MAEKLEGIVLQRLDVHCSGGKEKDGCENLSGTKARSRLSIQDIHSLTQSRLYTGYSVKSAQIQYYKENRFSALCHATGGSPLNIEVEKGQNPGPTVVKNFHFTTTLLTSIGYGNLVPISPVGRIFCICYAFLGIPLTLITIADVAKVIFEKIPYRISHWQHFIFFADLLMNAANRWRRSNRGREITTTNYSASSQERKNGNSPNDPSQSYSEDNRNIDADGGGDVSMLAFQAGFWTKTFVLSLLFFYMTATALIFSVIQETWNFLDSFYFCLITLTLVAVVESFHYGLQLTKEATR
ncbi:ion channel domain-containing protein [Ditylenchus destructor]|uniref:Ion channel domain-containing protein n=1 Tax=Ditylenchus destructor TaxID=166010 RepID=A0AAD4R049_9BILA|nr:ion channel domain-containing protein [Ditylenchus destructor]